MREYIEDIKALIVRETKGQNYTKLKVDSLFDKIISDILLLAGIKGYPEIDEITLKSYFEVAKKEFLSIYPIDPGISHSLTKEGFTSWLDNDRMEELKGKWNYSERYFQLLKKQGRSEKVIDEVRRSSIDIVKKIADPKSNVEIYKKGLVVGAVQSGKTGNFNAVINRSIDSGYKLIIVLSGIMEDLRSQTQKRIESDVIGEGRNEETNVLGRKGVGEIVRFGQVGNSVVNQVVSITSIKSDFNSNLLDADFSIYNSTNVLVCKKNVSVLRNLIVWLHDHLEEGLEQHNIPFLILDDEADNASLNNAGAKGREYASKTNGHIRALLQLFKIKTYLGYTATPFANVLQDRNGTPENDWIVKYRLKDGDGEKLLKRVDNIFPDDFIILLDPPSNYIGAKQIFETIKPIENNTEENEKIPLVAQPINDHVNAFPSRVYLKDDGTLVGVRNFENKEEWIKVLGTNGSYMDFDSFSEYKKNTQASKKEDPFPQTLPDSLKEAINCFILTLAIRESRIPKMMHSILYNPHNTMLIHTSRFTLWQNRTKIMIKKYVDEIISRINHEKPNSANSVYKELELVWYKNYAHVVENIKNYLPVGYEDEFLTPIVFDSLKGILPFAIKGIEIKAINSFTKDSLEYPKNNPKKLIAIGGNRLSRGFTLEGLSINYFVRTTNYSDTLLQMGRWFGYRPGYIDCCKIFTTQSSLDKFNSTTRCVEELEEEFKKMEGLNKTPEKFIIRVRKHPGTLQITRPSILKNSKLVKWSYQDQLEMTTSFDVSKQKIENVWSQFKTKIAPRFEKVESSLITFKANGQELIEILTEIDNNFAHYEQETMAKFISLCNETNMLDDWTIALKTTGTANRTSGKGFLTNEELNLNDQFDGVQLAVRTGPKSVDDINKFQEENVFKASGKNANIISSNLDLAVSLNDEEKRTAEKNFYNKKANDFIKNDNKLSFDQALEMAKQKVKTVPESAYRSMLPPSKGVLIIYLFDSYYSFNQTKDRQILNNNDPFDIWFKGNNINLDIPLIGYVIGFPPIEDDPGGTYLQGDYDLDIDEGTESDELEEMIIDLNEN